MGTGGVAQVVKLLPSKREALSSNPCTRKKKKKKKEDHTVDHFLYLCPKNTADF
jgi:hypothetical protein